MRNKLNSLLVAVALLMCQTTHAQWQLNGNNNATAASMLGTTNAFPLNLTTNNVQRLVIDANGKVGIGIAAPPNVLSVKGSGGVPAAVWVNSGNPLFTGFGEQTVGNADYILSMASSLANARPVFIGRRARGTLAAPTAVINNDQVMSFLSSGYDGTAFQNAAAIDLFVDGTPSAGSVPTRISFVTGSNSGNRAERLKIGNTGDISINTNQLFVQKMTGNVGIGNILPQAKMDITGNIKIADGTQAAGKVLTSDSAGLASWQPSDLITLAANATTNPAFSCVANVGTIVTGLKPHSLTVSGNYAYVVDYNSSDLRIYDISNPAAPVWKNTGGTATGASPFSVAVSGNYAYVVDYGGNDLRIYDISNPAAPVWKNTGGTATGSSPLCVAVSGNYAYVVEYGNSNNPNLRVYDISNPATPVWKNTGGTATGSYPVSVAVSGNYAYVVDYNSNDLRVYDISNPAAPVWKNTGGTTTGTNPRSVAVSGNYAYMVDYNSNDLRVYDISNPATPVWKNTGGTATGTYPISVAVSGNYAYVVDYNSSDLRIYDISNPDAPVWKNTTGTATGTSPVAVAISGNYAYVVNYDNDNMQAFSLAPCNGNITINSQTGTLSTQTTLWQHAGTTTYNSLAGNVGVGTTSANDRLEVAGYARATGYRTRNGSAGSYGGGVFNYYWTGSALQAWIGNTNVGNITLTSDRRLKDNINPLPNDALAKVMKLRPVSFHYKTIEGTIFKENPQMQEGFIADELQSVIPSAVNGTKDALTNDGKIQPQTVNALPVVSVLTKAMQELAKKNEQLQKQIDELKAMMQQLLNNKSTAPCPPLAGQ